MNPFSQTRGNFGLTPVSSPVFATVKLSNLTDGYLPKHTSDAVGLENSPIYTDGTNVGIGQSNPDSLLYLGTNTALTAPRLRVAGASDTIPLQEWGDGGVVYTRIGRDSSNVMYMSQANYSNASFEFRGKYNFTENVGIGNGTPDALLGLKNTSTFTDKLIQFPLATNALYLRPTGTGGQIQIWSDQISSNVMTWTTLGVVGIGTTSPASKLSVSGNLSVGANYAAVAAPTNGAIFEGNVGIGTSTPNTGYKIDMITGTVGDTVGSTIGSIRVMTLDSAAYASELKLFSIRHTAGTTWGGIGLRLQQQVQSSPMSYIEFNPILDGGGATQAIAFGHNNTEFARFISAGYFGINTTNPTAALDINSDILRLRTAKTPASASAAGNAGDICWDSSYIYVCTATNTWKRSAIATW